MKKTKFTILVILIFNLLFLKSFSQVKIYNVSQLEGHTEKINALVYSQNGKLIASGSSFRSFDDSDSGKFEIIIWDVSSKKIINRLLGHNNSINSICFDNTNTKLISADSKGVIKIWDLLSFKEIKSIKGIDWISSIKLTPDNRFFICEYEFAKKVEVRDFKNGELINSLDVGSQIGNMDISPDGTKIALSCFHSLQIWSLISNNKLISIEDDNARGFQVQYSPNGKLIGLALANGNVNFYEPENLIQQFSFSGHFKPVVAISFSKGNDFLISGSSDMTAKVWDLKLKKEIKSLVNIHKGTINCVSFSPQRNTFITTGDDKLIKIWDIR